MIKLMGNAALQAIGRVKRISQSDTGSTLNLLKDATITLAMTITKIHHVMHGYDVTALQKTDLLVSYAKSIYDHRDHIIDHYQPDVMISRMASVNALIDKRVVDQCFIPASVAEQINADFEVVSESLAIISSTTSDSELGQEKLNEIRASLSQVIAHAEMPSIPKIEDVQEEIEDALIDSAAWNMADADLPKAPNMDALDTILAHVKTLKLNVEEYHDQLGWTLKFDLKIFDSGMPKKYSDILLAASVPLGFNEHGVQHIFRDEKVDPMVEDKILEDWFIHVRDTLIANVSNEIYTNLYSNPLPTPKKASPIPLGNEMDVDEASLAQFD